MRSQWPKMIEGYLLEREPLVMVFVLVMIAIVSALDLAFGKAVFAVFGGETSTTTGN